MCSDIEREVTSGESDMSMFYACSVGVTALFMSKKGGFEFMSKKASSKLTADSTMCVLGGREMTMAEYAGS